MKYATIKNPASPKTLLRLKYCDTYGCSLLGLMFTKEIKHDGGIIIAEKKESRSRTAIHMMFMRYDIAVLWLDKDLVIVDKVLARKWAPYYAPKLPAQYVIEAHASILSFFSIGDKLLLTKNN